MSQMVSYHKKSRENACGQNDQSYLPYYNSLLHSCRREAYHSPYSPPVHLRLLEHQYKKRRVDTLVPISNPPPPPALLSDHLSPDPRKLPGLPSRQSSPSATQLLCPHSPFSSSFLPSASPPPNPRSSTSPVRLIACAATTNPPHRFRNPNIAHMLALVLRCIVCYLREEEKGVGVSLLGLMPWKQSGCPWGGTKVWERAKKVKRLGERKEASCN